MKPAALLLAIPWLVAALATSAAPATTAPGAERAAPAVALDDGLFVSVKGRFIHGALLARSVEPSSEQAESIRGALDLIDAERGRLRMGALEVALDAESGVQDDQGKPVTLSDLPRGATVKISFETDAARGGRAVDKVKLRAEPSDSIRLEGRVEQLDALAPGGPRFAVLGVTVATDSDTKWDGIRPPPARGVMSDEDRRPARAVRLGKAGWLSGEVVGEYRSLQDADLTNLLQDSFERARSRASIEWTLPSTRRLSAMAEVKLQRDWFLLDDVENSADATRLRLGETYLEIRDLMGPGSAIQVGRLDWEDEREWWFKRDMDTLRLSFQWKAWSLAAAVAMQVADPEYDLKDARHVLLEARWQPRGRHRLALYAMDRGDWYRFSPTSRRAFEPRHYGFHAEGRGKKLWRYWADAAIVRGADDGVPLHGYGYDLGVVLAWKKRVEPSLVISHAMGSGDPDPTDDVLEDFRQTGLHENNGKWNGVTSFHYYGDVLRPELSNLRIATIAFGLRLPDDWSLDVIWHGYDLDELAGALISSDAGENRRLNLTSKDVGSEMDVIIAYEGLEHWEFELDLGRFEPGDAWLGPTDPATGIYFKTKYIF